MEHFFLYVENGDDGLAPTFRSVSFGTAFRLCIEYMTSRQLVYMLQLGKYLSEKNNTPNAKYGLYISTMCIVEARAIHFYPNGRSIKHFC